MDKLTIATQVLLKLIETDKTGFDAEGIAAYSFEIADAMQAEAEKRESKERPDVLKEEWQPDWSKAPDGYDYFVVGLDGGCGFFSKSEPKFCGDHYLIGLDLVIIHNHGYQGNWKESLRKRPEALCQVDWSVAPCWAKEWVMRDGVAKWECGIYANSWEDAPSFGFTGSHIVERPHGF